ncbi:MAG TPA: DUF4377 domain-containing protein [Longimicrobium sp.]|nr:DUF4377 domain-containing protein [Longimicrobium sp.]
MRLHRILLLPVAAALLAACGATRGGAQNQVTYYVAPFTRECTGEMVMQCMLVKETPAGEWENFYDTIEGFTYEPGYDYVLRVGWREVSNPPADGSSRAYWLIETVEKKPAATR